MFNVINSKLRLEDRKHFPEVIFCIKYNRKVSSSSLDFQLWGSFPQRNERIFSILLFSTLYKQMPRSWRWVVICVRFCISYLFHSKENSFNFSCTLEMFQLANYFLSWTSISHHFNFAFYPRLCWNKTNCFGVFLCLISGKFSKLVKQQARLKNKTFSTKIFTNYWSYTKN